MASSNWKRTIAALALGGATVALGGSAASSVWAQQAPASAPSTNQQAPGQNRPDPAARQQQHQQFLTAVAAKLNVSVEQLQQALHRSVLPIGTVEHRKDDVDSGAADSDGRLHGLERFGACQFQNVGRRNGRRDL